MPKVYTCPFWTWEEGKKLHCEGAMLRFKSRAVRAAYISRYCANLPGWEGCPMAAALQRAYETGVHPCPDGPGCDTLKEEKGGARRAGKDGRGR